MPFSSKYGLGSGPIKLLNNFKNNYSSARKEIELVIKEAIGQVDRKESLHLIAGAYKL